MYHRLLKVFFTIKENPERPPVVNILKILGNKLYTHAHTHIHTFSIQCKDGVADP